jgi:hypothetical protein
MRSDKIFAILRFMTIPITWQKYTQGGKVRSDPDLTLPKMISPCPFYTAKYTYTRFSPFPLVFLF